MLQNVHTFKKIDILLSFGFAVDSVVLGSEPGSLFPLVSRFHAKLVNCGGRCVFNGQT